MLKNSPIAMPSKHKAIKKINGIKYVYHVLRSYRVNGKPKYDSVCIGKEDEKTGLLIPNETYYQIYPILESDSKTSPDLNCEKQKTEVSLEDADKEDTYSHHYGNALVMMHIANDLGIDNILEAVFPEDHQEILKIAFYMACEGTNIMSGINTWQDTTHLFLGERIDESRCSQIFSDIDITQRMNFFELWMDKHAKDGYVLYDTTMIQTYSKNIQEVQLAWRAKNKNLPQINLGMYYNQSSRLPMYYNIYQGSINDKKDVEFMLKHTKESGLKNVLFVLDRDFFGIANIKHILKNNYNVIMPLPASRKLFSELIDTYRKDLVSYENRIHDHNIYGKPYSINLACYDVNAHIFFDSVRLTNEERELFDNIESLKLELEKIKRAKKLPRIYNTFFNITLGTTKKQAFVIDYSVNQDKVKELMKYCGFFIILSSDKNLSSQYVFESYQKRDAIEKQFMTFKEVSDFKRMSSQTDHRAEAIAEGKMFVEFLSLILTTHILNKINESDVSKQVKKMSMHEIMVQLSEYYLISVNSNKSKTSLNKHQKEIMGALGIPGFKHSRKEKDKKVPPSISARKSTRQNFRF